MKTLEGLEMPSLLSKQTEGLVHVCVSKCVLVFMCVHVCSCVATDSKSCRERESERAGVDPAMSCKHG